LFIACRHDIIIKEQRERNRPRGKARGNLAASNRASEEHENPTEQPREHQPPGAQPNEQEREKQQGQATEEGQTPRPNRPTRPTQPRNEAQTVRTTGGNTPPILSLFSSLPAIAVWGSRSILSRSQAPKIESKSTIQKWQRRQINYLVRIVLKFPILFATEINRAISETMILLIIQN
jgi:hypothetical protein